MSELNHQPTTRPAAPASAPSVTPGTGDGAAEVYRRAVQARPTGFSEDPIGAMASAMDRIGRTAAKVVAGRSLEGRDGLADGEARLKSAMATLKANPGSLQARQEVMRSALLLLRDMQGLAANDPRRVRLSQFIVRLAGELGPQGLQLTLPGIDARGLLRAAAATVSRFGAPSEMQQAFSLEHILKASLPESSPDAVRLRDALMQRFGLSNEARQSILSNWAVRGARPGEVPKVDISARTLVLDAAQANPSLGVLARAFWHDRTMKDPAARDGFVDAFLKVASQGSFALLGRRYREVSSMARRELQTSRVSVLGADGPGRPATTGGRTLDESGDMFAALAVFARTTDDVGRQQHAELPEDLAATVSGFYAP